MIKTTAVCMLFAATTTATAEPTDTAPLVRPRTLATGQPACGNVMSKSVEPPTCVAARAIISAVVMELEEIRDHVLAIGGLGDPVEMASLTLSPAARPPS